MQWLPLCEAPIPLLTPESLPVRTNFNRILAAASEAKKLKKAERKARRKAPLAIVVQEKQREEQREADAKAEAARVRKVTRDLLRHHA